MSNYRGSDPAPPPPSAPGDLKEEYTISLSVFGGVAFVSVLCCVALFIAYRRGSSLTVKDILKSRAAAPAAAGGGGGGGPVIRAAGTMSNLAVGSSSSNGPRPSVISEDGEDEEAGAKEEEEPVLTAEDIALQKAIEAAWADPTPRKAEPARPAIVIDDGRIDGKSETGGARNPNRKETMDEKLKRQAAERVQQAVRRKQELQHREERARMLKMGGRPKTSDFEGWTHKEDSAEGKK